MGVYKEAMYCVAELKRKQIQIFDDAADYGIPIKDEKDPVFNLVRQLKEMYFDPETDKEEVIRFSLGVTKKLVITMIDEYGDGSEFPVTIEYTRQAIKRSRAGALVGILSIYSDKW